MKFPRNARIFKGRLDAAPIATVFFLLVMFLMLGSLVYTPGVRLELPSAAGLAGIDQPNVSVAIVADGRLYYQNQGIDEHQLAIHLHQAALESPEPLTLVIQADKKVTYDMLLNLTLLAREAGITNGLLAALPRPFSDAPHRSIK